jgi:hypothetical protein
MCHISFFWTQGSTHSFTQIYRCYVVWDDNPYVIVLPLILLINSTGKLPAL